MNWSLAKVGWIVVQVLIQIAYAWWNYFCLFRPLMDRDPSLEDAIVPMTAMYDEHGEEDDVDENVVVFSEENELT